MSMADSDRYIRDKKYLNGSCVELFLLSLEWQCNEELCNVNGKSVNLPIGDGFELRCGGCGQWLCRSKREA